ncbi:chemotaxis protein CheB [Dyadobacter sp. OTU695]|uniref:chemotaxis protein CheB n=1 Tax=Dyadobacter sp. OTU695 TaxID=3043860 RepID=UPI00313C9775
MNEHHHIVSIGASAGGIEEITSFFDQKPLDGISYVVIQHLSPDFRTRMAELLARHMHLVIREAENGMLVETDHVYIIPNDKYMTILKGRLYITGKGAGHHPHLTINKFFNSLAADQGEKAIGIILSGMGKDGAQGILSIRNAGGFTIARNPETTEFGSMPANAIATGAINFVTEPDLMPALIQDYVLQNRKVLSDQNDKVSMQIILDLIRDNTAFDFSGYKPATLTRRTRKRAVNQNFSSLADYLSFLKGTPEEISALAKEFLISVTAFFRDEEAFAFLGTSIIPAMLEKIGAGEELKIWVPGCATGEEAYSIAMLVWEQVAGNPKNITVKIFATDIDNIALKHAGKGLYSSEAIREIPRERLEKFFTRQGADYKIRPELRKMVIFAQHDLVKNPPYCNIDLISCRNLLIYMSPTLQKKVFAMLLFGLKVDGHIMLGSSENPLPIVKNLHLVNKKWKIYKKLAASRIVNFDTFSLPEFGDPKRSDSKKTWERPKIANGSLAEAINLALANESGRLIVCIDSDNQVIKSYGDTSAFLFQKNFNSNLADLLPKPLLSAFNTLKADARLSNGREAVRGVPIQLDDLTTTVDLSLAPMPLLKDEQEFFLVIFSKAPGDNEGKKQDRLFDERLYHDQYTVNIESELSQVKATLSATYEQLDASLENLQSFNEELLSANEEMQSTNEEMQSVNEELDTINKELVEVNDDLNNYFRSNINGQLFINNELQLMKFSAGVPDYLNLAETDIGRPITHIANIVRLETIIHDCRQVVDLGGVVSREIHMQDGKWCQVVTMPYLRQIDMARKGAIVTFNDISGLKEIAIELDIKNIKLNEINKELDNFVHLASHDLMTPLTQIEGSIAVMNEIGVADIQLKEFLGIINTSVKRFRTLVQDIGTIAKVEADLRSMEPIDLEEVVQSVLWSLENKIRQTGAEITVNLEVKSMHFSKKNLRSILFNLVSNSIKYNESGLPVIKISTKKADRHIILSVQDNGVGIPEQELDQIFNLYGRLRHDIEGDGIGLYLTKRIIDASGGNLVVESTPGQGSNFSVHFDAGKL